MATIFPQKKHRFNCEFCNIISGNKKDFEKHLLTAKHKKLSSVNKQLTDFSPISSNMQLICNQCSKKYKSRVGLWKHSKNCIIIKEDEKLQNNLENQLTDKHMILMLLKDNNEFKNMMMDQNKKIMELAEKAGTNNSFNNSNNKTFNLQVFLNETCKDAINLTDFINQIKISINDLEETGQLGYADGISKVFIKNLNGIDYNMRPLHCSDSKREILYFKDDDQWTKDDEQKTVLTKAIKQVAHKNIKQISEWQKIHPEYNDPDSKQNDKYMKIVLNSMSGSTKEESDKNYEKIAKNIVKEVVIEKNLNV
uniref:C2H2-type domain-containing protein n=1 Tax=viral metagenome TaxID=1070528 RepID=A0A6C0KP31_9ZZZZ